LSEYLDHVSICPTCKIDLKNESLYQEVKNRSDISKEQLKDTSLVQFVKGTLENCRGLEKILLAEKIPSAVLPIHDTPKGSLGALTIAEYILLVREEDVEQINNLLKEHFRQQVALEGKGEFVEHLIKMEEDTLVCPACGENFTKNNKECPSCGLFLGEPEH